jgi:hypothetical protein
MAYLAWGFGVMMAIYIAGGISGAHLNPTISIMLAIFRGFPWHDCWQYIIAQLLGSITASGIAYGLYRDAIAQYTRSKSISQAGPAFWTKPRDGLSNVSPLRTLETYTGANEWGFNKSAGGRLLQRICRNSYCLGISTCTGRRRECSIPRPNVTLISLSLPARTDTTLTEQLPTRRWHVSIHCWSAFYRLRDGVRV